MSTARASDEDGRYTRLRERGAEVREHVATPPVEAVEAPAPRDLDRYLEPVPAGRRTVTITGRPDSLAVTRRPPRTIDERIAHRPERIASWTCAMGFLLSCSPS